MLPRLERERVSSLGARTDHLLSCERPSRGIGMKFYNMLRNNVVTSTDTEVKMWL